MAIVEMNYGIGLPLPHWYSTPDASLDYGDYVRRDGVFQGLANTKAGIEADIAKSAVGTQIEGAKKLLDQLHTTISDLQTKLRTVLQPGNDETTRPSQVAATPVLVIEHLGEINSGIEAATRRLCETIAALHV